MIEQVIIFIQSVLLPLGGWGVLLGSIIEEVVAIIPSALVQMGGGFFLVTGALTALNFSKLFFIVAIPAAIGVTVGAGVIFLIFRHGGKAFIDHYGSWFGVSWNEIKQKSLIFRKQHHEYWFIFFLRIIPMLPSIVVCTYSAVSRISFIRYLVVTFFGTIISAYILGFLGWQLGVAYETYAESISHYENVIFVSLLACIGIYIVYRLIRRKSFPKKI